MLKLHNVSKIYDKNNKAVNKLNLKVNSGEIFGFLGPNGAGKTTTIKMVTGILAPTEGEIFINGYNIKTDTIKAQNNFSYVPDHPRIFDSIRGIDYLNFIADIYQVTVKERKKRIENYTQKFGIYEELTNTIKNYSHGMKQKLLISAALLPDPNILILDEPLSGLDPYSSRILKNIMKYHCEEGGTVFFSSHVLEVVENLCDRVGIINKGKLIICGKPEDIIKEDNKSLEEVFMELTINE
ncbi:MAG: ABC transporter ATP-binding protein [Halanaerobiales bacterium]